jgi:glutamine cyclotransferase
VEILAEYPHDPNLYTQGLVYHEGSVLESHGGYGRSGLMRYPLGGEPTRRLTLDETLFGEGLERIGGTLAQLTWRAGRVLRYDLKSFAPLAEWRLRGEGWGLAFDGEVLWVSNGTHLLTAHDPETFARLRSVAVYRGSSPQTQLNELEWAEGALYANVYETDDIVRIDLATGTVTAVIDAAGLLAPDESIRAEVLNGIAYRADRGTFLLTGKYWPRLFEVRFVPHRGEPAPQ